MLDKFAKGPSGLGSGRRPATAMNLNVKSAKAFPPVGNTNTDLYTEESELDEETY